MGLVAAAAEGVGLVGAAAAELADFAVVLLGWQAEGSGLTAAAVHLTVYYEIIQAKIR